ncbi:glycosyltransferase family 2 protein [Sphingobacterium spiritivorum]|uniref:glycosyltransferase family 2 protein n=1 Tax=Sphingobacterium spiritivorum TaxID=258 RepID=UPI003DA464C4
MNKEYKVSVIIPVFNVEPFIARCCRYLFEQTLEEVEYIFIDDCSPDNSITVLQQVLEEFPVRKRDVKIIRHERNLGLPSARNSGLQLASGEYIYHCDSDDWVEKRAFEEMYTKIKSENADVVWSDFYYTYINYETLERQSIQENSEECIKALMSEKMHGGVWNKMYKRDLFLVNQIRFPDGRDMWEDLYTNIRLFYFANKVVYIDKAFYHYNQDNTKSLGKSLNHKKLSDIISNTNATVQFIKAQEGDQYAHEINLLKLAAKQTLLFTCNKESFIKWREIYPESNPYILKFKALPFHLRVLGWATSNRIWGLINVWIYLKSRKYK